MATISAQCLRISRDDSCNHLSLYPSDRPQYSLCVVGISGDEGGFRNFITSRPDSRGICARSSFGSTFLFIEERKAGALLRYCFRRLAAGAACAGGIRIVDNHRPKRLSEDEHAFNEYECPLPAKSSPSSFRGMARAMSPEARGAKRTGCSRWIPDRAARVQNDEVETGTPLPAKTSRSGIALRCPLRADIGRALLGACIACEVIGDERIGAAFLAERRGRPVAGHEAHLLAERPQL